MDISADLIELGRTVGVGASQPTLWAQLTEMTRVPAYGGRLCWREEYTRHPPDTGSLSKSVLISADGTLKEPTIGDAGRVCGHIR